MAIYAGSTPKFLVKIVDEDRVQLDPSNALQVKEVLIYISNSITNTIVAKLYLNNSPDAEDNTWGQSTMKDLGGGDKRVLFALTAEQTKAAEGNRNNIQVTYTIPDMDLPSGERTIIKKGHFHEVKPAI